MRRFFRMPSSSGVEVEQAHFFQARGLKVDPTTLDELEFHKIGHRACLEQFPIKALKFF